MADSENNFTLYLQIHRKYKFWFNFYYLFVFFIFLFLPLNVEDISLIAEYREIKSQVNNIKIITRFTNGLNPDPHELKDLPFLKSKNNFKILFDYPTDGMRFQVQKKYFKKRRKFLIDLSNEKYNFVHDSIYSYLNKDSMNIIRIQNEYVKKRESEKILLKNPSKNEIQNLNDKISNIMFAEINNTIESLVVEKLKNIIKIIPDSNIVVPEKYKDITFHDFKNTIKLKSSKLDTLEKKHKGEIPYVGAKLAFKRYILLIYIINLISIFALPLYYIYYKSNEREILKIYRTINFNTVIKSIINKKNRFYLIIDYLPLITIIFFPLVITCFLSYLVTGIWGTNFYWISVVIITIYLFFIYFLLITSKYFNYFINK